MQIENIPMEYDYNMYYKIPSTEVNDDISLFKIVEKVKRIEGVEGAVAYTDNGMVKIKIMWYLERHILFTNKLDNCCSSNIKYFPVRCVFVIICPFYEVFGNNVQ